MTEQETIDEIIKFFPLVEGRNAVYYGKTRNGKTRTATADILDLLDRGEVVMANWEINWQGFDERSSSKIRWVSFFSRRKQFFIYKKENFIYMNPTDLITGKGKFTIDYLKSLVGVHLFIDEGQWVLPSLERTLSPELLAKMELVLHGGHYCRSLNIITQRPQNISRNTRSQINIWYRCVKRIDMRWFIIFQRWEIEDMSASDDMPIEFEDTEDGRKVPNGLCETYFANKRHDRVFEAYNTHGMRQKNAIYPKHSFEIVETNWKQRLKLIAPKVWPFGRRE